MNSTDITVVIPIVTLEGLKQITTDSDGNEKTINLVNSCFNSITTQKQPPSEVILVVPSGFSGVDDLELKISETTNPNNIPFNIVMNDGDTSYQNQINVGVSKVNTEYFSVIGLDDQYSSIWFENVVKYNGWYDLDVYLPLCVNVSPNGGFLNFTNEPVWARDFSDKLGFLDNDSVLNYPNFQFFGSVIKKSSYESVGGLKPSIKTYEMFELFLRLTYYSKTIMTIPKVGYRKVNFRVGSKSHTDLINKETKIDPVELRFWYNTSKKESYHKTDRVITYNTNG